MVYCIHTMSATSKKVAVSIPAPLYQAVERTRRKSGQGRSAAFQEALQHWLREQEEAGLRRRYVAGYRREPETEDEIRAAESAAVQLLSSQPW
jgi:metal-responsive CopG/Arc/MetJ family transcriptional regulator